MKHLAVFTDLEVRRVLSGELKYYVRFFKSKPKFISQLSIGDKVFIRKGSNVLARFEVGKVIIIENSEESDFEIVKNFSQELKREEFEDEVTTKRTILMIQIQKLEQLITSPVDVPYNLRKEWLVLE